MTTFTPSIFKAYDVRGLYPTEIDEDTVYRITQGFIHFYNPKTVVLARDVRLSGPSLWSAAKNAFIEQGIDVIDIGVVSTDMMYFAVANYGYDAGITISASHNPKEYNGMKFVRDYGIPLQLSGDLDKIRDWVQAGNSLPKSDKLGTVIEKYILEDYCKKVLSFLKKPLKKTYKVVANGNFGMAGIALRKVIEMGNLPIELIELDFEPNGEFPKGRPDPLLESNRLEIGELIRSNKADFGIAWDADADRTFFVDENGNFLEGYFCTAIQSEYFLKEFPGGKVISDTRLVWAVKEAVEKSGGEFIYNKAGHTIIKAKMRELGAIFGGEMSAHYFYKDCFQSENGMVSFVILLQIAEKYEKFSDIFSKYTSKYFVSGEINSQVLDIQKVLNALTLKYSKKAKMDTVDGVSFEFDDYRFNVRPSNTESIPLLRLNLEALSSELMQKNRDEVLQIIKDNSN